MSNKIIQDAVLWAVFSYDTLKEGNKHQESYVVRDPRGGLPRGGYMYAKVDWHQMWMTLT
jgi:hypothetical protein